jgi:hypothetical protein
MLGAMRRISVGPDALVTAIAIARSARIREERRERLRGSAPVAALVIGVSLALTMILLLVTDPAANPLWCAAHGGCG